MKALVLEKNAHLVYKEVPEPKAPREGCLLVRIVAAGICGSDIHRGFEGGAYHYPLIMGHEMAGVVEDPGGSSRFAAGDRVAVFPLLPCYRCGPCRIGRYAQCVNYDYYGSRRDGGFAERLRVPEENLFPVPEHVSTLHAAMTEPCAVALHAVRKLPAGPGLSAAVIGGGPIGNMCAQWLRTAGYGPVCVVDVDPAKVTLASEMGMVAVDAAKTDPVEQIRLVTGGGADVVVEAAGLPVTVLQALHAVRSFGQVVLLGNLAGILQASEKDYTQILRKELTLHGTWNSRITPGGRDDWSSTLANLDRSIEVGPLISHTPGLPEGPEIFAAIAGKRTRVNKVIFRVSEDV